MAMTAVTATVTDSDGTLWQRGSWKLEFVPNPSIPNLQLYVVDGTTPLNPTVIAQAGSIDNTGYLSFACYDTTSITPVGSSWKLTVCPLSSARCGFYNFQTAGSAIDISSALTFLLPPPRFLGTYPNYGYADLEVIPSNKPGGTYYNVVSQMQRYYNDQTGTWANVGTGPQGPQGPPGIVATPLLGAQDPNTLTTSGIYFLPDGFSANGPNPPFTFDALGGVLEVFAASIPGKNPYILQRFQASQDMLYNPAEFFIRWYYTNASSVQQWSNWYYYEPTGSA